MKSALDRPPVHKILFITCGDASQDPSKKIRIRQNELFIPIRNTGLPDPDQTSNNKWYRDHASKIMWSHILILFIFIEKVKTTSISQFHN